MIGACDHDLDRPWNVPNEIIDRLNMARRRVLPARYEAGDSNATRIQSRKTVPDRRHLGHQDGTFCSAAALGGRRQAIPTMFADHSHHELRGKLFSEVLGDLGSWHNGIGATTLPKAHPRERTFESDEGRNWGTVLFG